jgi:hypothetical protein
MNGFLAVTDIQVPWSVVDEANSHLREVGRRGLEGFSLWAGRQNGQSFSVETNIIPVQTGHRSESGVCVSVDSQELHRINVWLYENSMTLIAQLHSHPTEAYHSDTDDAYPIATTVGSLSIVVPNYARQPFSLAASAVYRLIPQRGWVFMSPKEVTSLITIIDKK